MFGYVEEIIQSIELDPFVNNRESAIHSLRALGLDDFGEVLLSMPNSLYPKLSRLLPSMPNDDIQKNWTGASGLTLLKRTSVFVRTMIYSYVRITGRPLSDLKVLDFGCGYGRIARLMYYFTDESKLFGVDPWDESINLCHASHLGDNFIISDYLPTDLPVSVNDFDLIYAFSVFTHLSERATLAALSALRKHIGNNGVLVITIRPVEYWDHDIHTDHQQKIMLNDLHHSVGFAFNPHNRATVNGDVTYGDTSITLEWLKDNARGWEVDLVDRSLEDPLQRYVFLKPKL